MTNKNQNLRASRRRRIRSKISGSATRPRLAVYRSNRFISGQLIDDAKGHTIGVADDRQVKDKKLGKTKRATAVGQALAELAGKKGIKEVVFDRAGYRYHGRIKALAEGARAGGLKF